MKKHLLLVIVFTIALITAAFAQGSLTGTVVDSETKLPLEGASVFAQNTTIGAVTKNDGSFKLSLGKGGYEIIISFTGYESQTMNVDGSESKTLNIELKKEDKSLSEVVVQASNEVPDGWQQYGDFFLEHFIGKTPNASMTVLENPEVLKFYFLKKSNKLRVLATDPLKIINNALGYTMQYDLDSFVYYYNTNINSYRGNCLYALMEGTEEQQDEWEAKREKAYYGSRLHFLRAYYDSTLARDGFTVDILSAVIRNKFDRLANPYDANYYYADTLNDDVELWFPKKVSITYYKSPPEQEYLSQMLLPQDVKYQISYVDLRDAIIIKPNGYFIDQRSWVNEGYWSWKNIADQLPFDYEPYR